jgi:hypothetical protein
MRGLFRTLCAAGVLALLANAAPADDSDSAKSVPVTLVAQSPVPRSAADYLAGSPFSATIGGSSASVFESGDLLPAPFFTSSYGPPAPRQSVVLDFAARIALSPALSLDLGYQLDDAGRMGLLVPSTVDFDGLFLSSGALGLAPTPYGTSSYVGASLKLSNEFKLHVGDAIATRDRNTANTSSFSTIGRPVNALINLGARTANSIFGGASYDSGSWASIDLTATRTTMQQQAIFGPVPIPGLSSSALDVTANVRFDGGWVTTASYGDSLTKLDVKPSALALSSAGELHRTGYAVAVAKHGVFGDDALGLSVSRPADPEADYATFGGHVSQPAFIGADHLLMINQKPETDIEVGYVTNFLDGAVALQTNAAYDMNFQGQSGTNAVQLLSRAKIKF